MTTTVDRTRPPSVSVGVAARAADVCAAWAAAGVADEYVVYERDGRWVFAGGRRAGVVLTGAAVALEVSGGDRTSRPWSGRPATVVADVLATLPFADWRVYGWVGFDFCAPALGHADRVDDESVLAHLVVPEFEAWVDADGIRIDGADAPTATRMTEIAGAARSTDGPRARPTPVTDDVDGYRDRVRAAIDEIRAGAYEKVIMSRAVDVPFDVDIPATYRRGRVHNNPARSFLLRLGDLEAAGFSPEIVVSVDSSRTVTTEPLAGTRALGRSADLDRAARGELTSDAKEIVEHAVSVRTSCSEMASIAVPDTTAVTEYMAVRERGSVQHLASTVRASLDPRWTAWDALAALFPAVTASGIPKSAAVDAIYRLETRPRGLYSGAVLTASSDGELEATLALRTVFRQQGRSWMRAGAGVVGQSTPDREFEETCEKLGSVAPYLVEKAHPVDDATDTSIVGAR